MILYFYEYLKPKENKKFLIPVMNNFYLIKIQLGLYINRMKTI